MPVICRTYESTYSCFLFQRAGVDCVKFQKSCLAAKFTRAALARPYTSRHSFGRTYGEHKGVLEFSLAEMMELKRFATDLGLEFCASAMDEVSLDELKPLLPFIKIGSGDADNFPLLRKAKDSILIVSTGMQTTQRIRKIVETIDRPFCLLHCISSYPTLPEDLQLRQIEKLKVEFPNQIIGYSGHETGILSSCAAVLLGAKLIERHFTLDKTWKGSDHACSLTPNEMQKLITLIRRLEAKNCRSTDTETILRLIEEAVQEEAFLELLPELNSLNASLKEVQDRQLMPCELPCYEKLGKSLVFARNCHEGQILTPEDVCIKVSEPKGMAAGEYDDIVGKKLRKFGFEDDPITTAHLL